MIKRIQSGPFNEIAELHKNHLPSFLQLYSKEFMCKFYENALLYKENFLIGYFRNEELTAFILGSRNASGLFSKTISNFFLFFLIETFKIFLKNPSIAFILFNKIFNKNDILDFQLVYIVVGKQMENKGVGSILLESFEKEMKNYSDEYELEVEGDNTRAIHFYEKKKFRLIKVYGDGKRKYRKSIL